MSDLHKSGSALRPERRGETRRPAEGQITLFLSVPEAREIHGLLVDLSANGFRVIHDFAAFPSGLEIQFRYGSTAGRARAVWHRVVGPQVESGFLVI